LSLSSEPLWSGVVRRRTIGDKLRARHPKSQESEALIACDILNRTIAIGGRIILNLMARFRNVRISAVGA
jgi:hypothetical protein